MKREYCVRLNIPNNATSNQITARHLSFCGQIQVYTKNEAKKKAQIFNGTVIKKTEVMLNTFKCSTCDHITHNDDSYEIISEQHRLVCSKCFNIFQINNNTKT